MITHEWSNPTLSNKSLLFLLTQVPGLSIKYVDFPYNNYMEGSGSATIK